MLNKVQTNQINNALLQLGFTEKESKVYLSVLQNNEGSIITISQETGLSRGTVFDVVERLEEKGYVTEVKHGKRRRIVIENPTARFYAALEEKNDKVKKAQNIIDGVLPLIKSISKTEDFRPQIRVYEGEKGFRQVWDEILSFDGKDFLSIARIETFVKFIGKEFLKEIQERKVKAGISSRAINEDSLLAREMAANDVKYHRETRLAPKEVEFPSTEIIYGDNIAMFSTSDENIILVIESQDFVQTHRAYFEMLWKFLEKPKL